MDAGQSALLHVQTPPQLGHPAQVQVLGVYTQDKGD